MSTYLDDGQGPPRKKVKVSPVVGSDVLAKYKIEKLPYLPAFDRCLVFQIPELETEGKFAGTGIYMPEATRSNYERGACRGVLLAAGAIALDHLRSNNIQVGDTVWFSKLAPWRHVVGYHEGGKEIEMMFLRSADIAGSEQSLARYEDGAAMLMSDDGVGEHVWEYEDAPNKRHAPPVDEY